MIEIAKRYAQNHGLQFKLTYDAVEDTWAAGFWGYGAKFVFDEGEALELVESEGSTVETAIERAMEVMEDMYRKADAQKARLK